MKKRFPTGGTTGSLVADESEAHLPVNRDDDVNPLVEEICDIPLIIVASVCVVLLGILLGLTVAGQCGVVERAAELHKGRLRIKPSPNSEDNAFHLELVGLDDQTTVVRGAIGMALPNSVAYSDWNCSDTEHFCSLDWGDFAHLELKAGLNDNCIRIETTSTFARELEDCYDLRLEDNPDLHWYGGGETFTQTWPIEKHPRQLSPYVTGDFLQSTEYFYGGVVENYWLLSSGAAIHVDESVPLYVSINTTRPNQICFLARDHSPYTKRDKLSLGYDWCLGSNLKEAHQLTMAKFFEKPTGVPDERMLIQPFWSTWAEYKVDVNQEVVLDFSRKVISEGFVNSSHIEIDDNWEPCYGEEEFDSTKFPNPRAMIDEIKSMNDMRVTAWVHPFINEGCPKYQEAIDKGYFVLTTKLRAGITWWWEGLGNAGLIDMTNPEAVAWWKARLQKLQQETGLTSFKFDAGEANWLPASPNLNNNTNSDLWPQHFTTAYVDNCAEFGGLIETRVAHLNQKQPIFIRMLDKDSRWGFDNGLQSMIPTLLHMGIVGYPFVLPDMIGGNAYGSETASQEMYVRWMQVNIFMPAVQFSLVPWRIGETDQDKAETVRICLKVLAEREKYADHILAAARQAVVDGSPVNRPMWWVDPTDRATYAIDDAYMLGDTILVAPVVQQGQTSRDIYLPRGRWADQGDSSRIIEGPVWLRDYAAPLDVVPYFVKAD